MEVATYSPSDVVVTFGGYILEDWESITVERSLPSHKIITGIRGKNSRNAVKNTSATVTVELAQTSLANYIFQKIVELDEATGNGRISITIKDTLGGEVFYSDDTFIEAPASRTYSADISTRTWKMNCLSSAYNTSEESVSLSSIFDLARNLF